MRIGIKEPSAVVLDSVIRLQTVDQEYYDGVKSIERQRDLLALIIDFTRDRYGRGPDNREISYACHRLKTTAYYWQASAVYRHLRKRFRIKGEVCKIVETMDAGGVFHRSKDLFLGKRIAKIEDDLRKGKRERYIYYGGWDTTCVWEANAADLLSRPYPYNRDYNHFCPIAIPLEQRLAKYKKTRLEDRIKQQEQEDRREFEQWKATRAKQHAAE